MFSSDKHDGTITISKVRADIYELVGCAMKSGQFNAEYTPSEIAFACVMCARMLHGVEWNRQAFDHMLTKAGKKGVDLFHSRILKCYNKFREMAQSDSKTTPPISKT